MKLLIDGDFSLWSRSFDYDDCLALIMGLKKADVRAITCVGGNVNVKNSVSNALRVTSFTHYANVYEGLEPEYNDYFKTVRLFREFIDNRDFKLPLPESKGNAIDAINYYSKRVDKGVFLGPLTNLRVSNSRFNELVVMGGAINMMGNITPFAEFNAYLDPLGFDYAFSQNTTIIPFNVSIKAIIGRSVLKRFIGPLSHLNKISTLILHDPLAMTYALKPKFFRTKKIRLKIETSGLYRGKLSTNDEGKLVNVVTGFDRNKFIDFFIKSLGSDLISPS